MKGLFQGEVKDEDIRGLLRGNNHGDYIGHQSMVYSFGPDVYSLDLFDGKWVNKLTAYTQGIWALEVFEGVLYAGSEDGCVYNLCTKEKMKNHSSHVYCLCEHEGSLFAGLVDGRVVDAFGNNVVRQFNNSVWAMASHKRELYVSDTVEGFYNVDYDGPTFTRDGRINCLYEYKDIFLDCGRYEDIRPTWAGGVFAKQPDTASFLDYLFEFNDNLYVLDSGGDIFDVKGGEKKFSLRKRVDSFLVVDREVLAGFDSYMRITDE